MKRNYIFISITLVITFLFSLLMNGNTTNIMSISKKEYNDIPNNKEGIVNNQTSDKESSKSMSSTTKYIIGNINVKGTSINHKLVQAKDNDYFLDHDPYGNIDPKGSIYMDYRNIFSDRKLLIYGHNSKTLKNALFHDLEKYLNYSFYEKNKYIELELKGEKAKYQIFSVMIVNPGDNSHMKITFNDKEWIEHIDWMKKKSLYNTNVEVGLSDKIITLQTCYYNPDDSYLVINAKKVK